MVWYGVLTVVKDSWQGYSKLMGVRVQNDMPPDTKTELKDRDIYWDWFDSKEAAERFAEYGVY